MHALCEDIRRHVLKEIDLTKECSDEELQDIISKIASDFYKRYDISIIERVKIEEKLYKVFIIIHNTFNVVASKNI